MRLFTAVVAALVGAASAAVPRLARVAISTILRMPPKEAGGGGLEAPLTWYAGAGVTSQSAARQVCEQVLAQTAAFDQTAFSQSCVQDFAAAAEHQRGMAALFDTKVHKTFVDLEHHLINEKGITANEWGHSLLDLPTKTAFLSRVLKEEPYDRVCVVGFETGHTTLLALELRPSANVTAFDFGDDRWIIPSHDFIEARHPNDKIVLYLGDIPLVVPRFAMLSPDFRCDLMIVSGNLEVTSLHTALIDLKVLANSDGHMVIMDVPHDKTRAANANKAWDDAIARGDIVPAGAVTDKSLDAKLDQRRDTIKYGTYASMMTGEAQERMMNVDYATA